MPPKPRVNTQLFTMISCILFPIATVYAMNNTPLPEIFLRKVCTSIIPMLLD